MRRLSGFSLMEMMVVLLIVSIVAAASAPMISKKAVSNAENDSPWVWTGLNNNIAYNLNNAEQTAIIGDKYVPNDASKSRLFIKTKDKSHPQISLHDTVKSLKFLWANNSIAMTNKDVSTILNDTVVIGNDATLSKPGAIAIGSGADASGTYGIAVGYKAIGSGTMFGAESNAENCALAVGHKATASKDYSVAVGHTSTAKNANAIAIGYNSEATGGGGIAIGKNAQGDGTMIGHDSSAAGCSVAFGPSSRAPKAYDTAIGYSAETASSGNGSATALGYNATANNSYSVAIGADSTTGGVSSIAIGYGATTVSSAESDVSGSTAIAIGLEAEASGTRTVAIGDGVVVRGKESVMIGHGSQCNSEGAVVIGGIDENTTGAKPFGSTNSVAVGRAAMGGSPNSVALGAYSYSTQDSVAVGYDAYTEDVDAVSVGCGTTSGKGSVAIGSYSKAANLGIAIGSYNNDSDVNKGSANASGVGATAIGYGTLASGEDSIALGSFSEASGPSSIAIGAPTVNEYERALASGDNSIAIGAYARAKNKHSVALGYGAYANGENSVAIGPGAFTNQNNEIMLGTGNHRVTIPGELNLPGTTLHVSRLIVDNDVILNKDAGMTLMRVANYGGKFTRLCWPGSEDFKGDDDNFREFLNGDKKLSNYKYEAWSEYNEFGNKKHEDFDDLTSSAQDTVDFFRKHILDGEDSFTFYGANSNFYAKKRVRLQSDYSPSDRRLKNVGEKFKGGLAELKKLDLYHFTFKKDESKTPHVGVMAQDLQKVFPNAVTKGEDGYLRIRWDEIFFALINAVKELDAKVDLLVKQQKKINELETKVDKLEKRLVALEKKLK